MDLKDLAINAQKIDWEFENQDTQYLTHNIHRYSGKFIPQIARNAIQLTSDPGDLILDPYLGSGTTALESILLKRKCIGIDLNPLAVLISKVKTLIKDEDVLLKFKQDLITSVKAVCDEQINIFPPTYVGKLSSPEDSDRYKDEWNKKWYQDDVLKQLIQIYDVIESVPDEDLQNIGKVAFSDILRKSSNASSKYPNVMYDKKHKKKALPLAHFIESFSETIDSLVALSKQVGGYKPEIKIVQGNNIELSLSDNSVDAIVTHPPYVAAVPYAEYGCLSLKWLGYDYKDLDNNLTGGKRQSKHVVERFMTDYKKMMAESFRVLKHGHAAFFMVGNPTSHGSKIQLDSITVSIAEEVGYKHIITCTRNGTNRRGNKMGQEYLEFFVKE